MRQRVLVTGAGTGLGLETALHLASKGFDVQASVLDDEQRCHVEALAKERTVRVATPLVDVTDPSTIEPAVESLVDDRSATVHVVHNAGVSLRGYFEDCDDDEIRRVFEVNVFGAMNVTRAVLPYMRRARRGRLVFVASIGGRIGSLARTAYCASKFGVEGFAESLMQEVAPFDLRVSIVEPAIIKTERWTVHRGLSRRAEDPASPYHAWFAREERLADQLVESSKARPRDMARVVYRALTARRPRLRYVVGRRAALILALRRRAPGELFERFYFGEVMRRVTGR